MTTLSDFKGLEGMLTFNEGKIGVLSNNHQFISYNGFNSTFTAQLDKFSREYRQSPDDYKLGHFNSESYEHLQDVNWENSNLILTDSLFKKLTNLENSLPKEIKEMNRHPIEKCMSAYMGMRLLSIFGNRIGLHPVLALEDKQPVVLNFSTVTSNPDFEKEIEYLIITSPLFIQCKSEEFKQTILQYCFNDIDFNNVSNHSPKELKDF